MLRLATSVEVPALKELIPLSARRLSEGWYAAEQIESLVQYVFGPDTQLIEDGTYWIAEVDGHLIGCGGWSRRCTLFGGDQMKQSIDPLLDPSRDAARVRAFFVHPAYARRGVGSTILTKCIQEARAAGFLKAELMATLPGVPLYRRFGFVEVEPASITLPDGVVVDFVRMARDLDGADA